MSTPVLTITNAGMAKLVALAGTEKITIAEIGLSASSLSNTPTRTSMPGLFKKVAAVSGTAADAYTLHLVMTDASDDTYDVRSIGLYLDDDTLFAIYSQPAVLFSKLSATTFVLQADVRFASGVADSITFGSAEFINPPATTSTPGVVELATDAETAAGTDTTRAVTPHGLVAKLTAMLAGYIRTTARGAPDGVAELDGDALVPASQLPRATSTSPGIVEFATTTQSAQDDNVELAVNPRGLMSVLSGFLPAALRGAHDGVASLDDSTKVPVAQLPNATTSEKGIVELATDAEVIAATDTTRAVTPKGLVAKLVSYIGVEAELEQNGYLTFLGLTLQWGRATARANGTQAVLFRKEFSSACFSVVASGTVGDGSNSQDNPPAVLVSTISTSGFSVFSADQTADPFCFIAVGV